MKIVTEDDIETTQLAKKGRMDFKVKHHHGLYLRVGTLTKNFYCRVTVNGKRKLVTLGHASTLTVAEAAIKAMHVRAGKDVKAKQAVRHSLADLLPRFYKKQVNHLRAPKAVYSVFDNYISPMLKDMPLDDIETVMLTDGINRIQEDSHHAANRTLTYLKRFFNWANASGYVKTNPAASLTASLFNFEITARERFLSAAELPVYLAALDDSKIATALRIILLTGVRVSELVNAKWWDITEAGWLLPAGNTKTQKALLVPIPPQVRALFETLRDGTSELVLGGIKRERISRYQKAITVLKERLTVHDLRRSFSTGLNGLGVAPHVVEKCLNHKVAGVAGVYNRSDYLTERRAALALWANHIDEVTA